jgi:hypothetical protein
MELKYNLISWTDLSFDKIFLFLWMNADPPTPPIDSYVGSSFLLVFQDCITISLALLHVSMSLIFLDRYFCTLRIIPWISVYWDFLPSCFLRCSLNYIFTDFPFLINRGFLSMRMLRRILFNPRRYIVSSALPFPLICFQLLKVTNSCPNFSSYKVTIGVYTVGIIGSKIYTKNKRKD